MRDLLKQGKRSAAMLLCLLLCVFQPMSVICDSRPKSDLLCVGARSVLVLVRADGPSQTGRQRSGCSVWPGV